MIQNINIVYIQCTYNIINCTSNWDFFSYRKKQAIEKKGGVKIERKEPKTPMSEKIYQKIVQIEKGKTRKERFYSDFMLDTEACGAVGHKANVPMMNQIRGGISPLQIYPCLNSNQYASAPDEKSSHGRHRGQTPKLVSYKIF